MFIASFLRLWVCAVTFFVLLQHSWCRLREQDTSAMETNLSRRPWKVKAVWKNVRQKAHMLHNIRGYGCFMVLAALDLLMWAPCTLHLGTGSANLGLRIGFGTAEVCTGLHALCSFNIKHITPHQCRAHACSRLAT